MFIVKITYVRPTEEIDALLESHGKFLEKHFHTGRFISAGRQLPRTGGIILCHGADKLEVAQLLTEDPFYVNKVADYDIIEFTASKASNDFRTLLDNLG
ncbi:GTP cyclohydrolase [Taibaiella soli]|uniref:GTP cyclohydrolase n=1 Tax=Taibaiella soli TaxID=1649169 RepID=A0A2W2AT42_9BACT|nr:GTP cyclohydrolase [Taibaiella soli]